MADNKPTTNSTNSTTPAEPQLTDEEKAALKAKALQEAKANITKGSFVSCVPETGGDDICLEAYETTDVCCMQLQVTNVKIPLENITDELLVFQINNLRQRGFPLKLD